MPKLLVPSRQPLRCFIASAFGREDVDAIHDRAIRPILSELKIAPYRVDQEEHNEDIDDRIFSLIDESHLCIADLTYARPSVYYEAGYAIGKGKPVIYIARDDHFRDRETDPNGNLRVHFDLRMKNIIAWTEANDTFRERLRGRIRHVLIPVLREAQKTADEQLHEEHFATLSQNEKLSALLSKALSLLRSRGYSRVTIPRHSAFWMDNYHARLHKTLDGKYSQAIIFARMAVNTADLRSLPFLWDPVITKEEAEGLNEIEATCFVIALRSSKASALTALFPSWTPLADNLLRRHDMATNGYKCPHCRRIAVIDGVKSVENFSERFHRLLE